MGQKVNPEGLRLGINKDWTAKYIDTDFYSFDYENVNDSLCRSSMVIGPHSTLMMDALCNGVNYYAFDPGEDGHTVLCEAIRPLTERLLPHALP